MTTLSVVPVRFEYACGHTALASLPRLKAESPSRRTARVEQEKAAAGQRSCDFCPPVAQPSLRSSDLDSIGSVAAGPLAPQPMDGGMGEAPREHTVRDDHVHELEEDEAMTTTTANTELTTAHDESPATPQTTPTLIRPKGVFPLRKLTDEQERAVTRLYAETATPLVEIGQRFGIGQTSVARIAQRHGAPLRSPTISRAMVSDRSVSAPATGSESAIASQTKPAQQDPVARPTVAPRAPGNQSATTSTRRTVAAIRRPRAEAPVGVPTAPAIPARTATRRVRTTGVARSTQRRRFTVTFATEQVLEAESALAALQQVQARGATEVTSIVRIT